MPEEVELYHWCLAHDVRMRCYSMWSSCIPNAEPPYWAESEDQWRDSIRARRKYACRTEAERVEFEIEISDNWRMANTHDEAYWQARLRAENPMRKIDTVEVESDVL